LPLARDHYTDNADEIRKRRIAGAFNGDTPKKHFPMEIVEHRCSGSLKPYGRL